MQHQTPLPPSKSSPTEFQKKSCWSALTGLSIVTTIALVAGGVLLFSYILGFLEPVLLPVVVAAVIAYLLNPLVEWLVKCKIPHIGSVCIVMGASFLAIVGFFWVIVPPLIQQTNELVDSRTQIWNSTSKMVQTILEKPMVDKAIDSMYNKSLHDINLDSYSIDEVNTITKAKTPQQKLSVYLELNSAKLFNKVSSWLTSGGKAIFGMIGITVGLVMTPIFIFYFLAESHAIKEHWHDLLPIKTSKFKEEVIDTLQEINGYLISFFRGQMLVSIIDGTLIAIVLKSIGLPYAFTIGAAVAVLGIIPYLGMIITVIPAALIAWFMWHDWQHVLLVIGIFTAVNQFDGWIIQPKIVGNSVGLHPLTIMFSVLFWTFVLGGLLGALLAVPLTAALKVLFRRYIWQTIQKKDPTSIESSSPPL
ncbi:MAG: AI-2E family transporter [Akkermansia sp.]